MTTALEGGEGSVSHPGRSLPPVPIVQKAWWVPGPVWTGAKNLAPTGIRSPDRPARSQSLYRLRYQAHTTLTGPPIPQLRYTLQKLSWFSQTVFLRRNIETFTYGQNRLLICALARNQLASQRLTVYLLVTTRVPVRGFSFNSVSLLHSIDIFQFRTKPDKNTRNCTRRPPWDSASISSIKRPVLIGQKNGSNKVTDNPNTHFTVHILFLRA
jgi:hypothetical protein